MVRTNPSLVVLETEVDTEPDQFSGEDDHEKKRHPVSQVRTMGLSSSVEGKAHFCVRDSLASPPVSFCQRAVLMVNSFELKGMASHLTAI